MHLHAIPQRSMGRRAPVVAPIARRHPGTPRWGDAGQVGGIESIPFGILLFVVTSLLVTNIWAVVDTKGAVDAAAHLAVRRYVEAPDARRAHTAAIAAARSSLAGRRGEVAVDIDAPRGFERCAPVAVTVSVEVPRLRLPFLGDGAGRYEVRATHREVVDPYRSGLRGAATC